MDRQTVFTKTAKGLMEATGKTSVLSRDMRALLKEIDGKVTVGDVQTKLAKVPEAKLQQALQVLVKNDFIREFKQPQTAASPQKPVPQKPAEVEMDLDFTMAIPTLPASAKKAEEEALQKAQVEADTRAKAEADASSKAAAAATAARARAEAEARTKAEAPEKAKASARTGKAAGEAEGEALEVFFEKREGQEAEEQARREAEDQARREAEERAGAQEQERIEAEARARKEAEEAKRRAREEAERKAKEEAERKRKEAEEQARREAEEQARKDAERKAKEEAERKRKEAEEQARREAEEQARKDAERKAREEAERVRKEAEEQARREAEEQARREAEERARAQERARIEAEETERKAQEEAERERKAAEEKERCEADELRARLEEERKAKEEAERRSREDAERKAKEEAERKRKEVEEQARREAEEAARREAEEFARREAEERARKEAEERASAQEQARVEAEARALKEAEDAERKAREEAERVRQAAEEKAARDAGQPPAPVEPGSSLDDLVKIETDFDAVLRESGSATQDAAKRSAGADDALQNEAEESARRQADEQARMEAEAKARAEAEAASTRAEEERRREDEGELAPDSAADQGEPGFEREHAEAQALLEAQDAETERHFAEMEKELEAEQAGAVGGKQTPQSPEHAREREQAATKERVRAAAAAHAIEAGPEPEQAQRVYRTPVNWGKPVALGLFLILVLGLVLVHFVSFDSYIPQFEKLAGAHLLQPVKIKSLHLSLVPQPYWRLDGVSVGNEGQLEVARVNAIAELGSMFSEQKVFKSIELESPVLSEDGLLALLFGKPQGQDFKVASVIVKNGKLNSKTVILPALDAKISVGEDGGWRQIALETPDHKTSLLLKPEGDGAQIEVETNAFSMPFDPAFILENFNAKGVVRRGELRLSELKGGIYGGYLSGNASLKWGADWSLAGEINVRAMDPGRFVPALLEEGKLEGKASYAMRAKSYDELFAAPRLEGGFAIQKGTLLGVDLGRLLQGGGVGGKTAFAELTGSFVREAGKTQLRQIHLGAGPVSAGGNADVDAGKHISGRFTVEIKSPVAQARANLAVSGTLKEPHFSR